MKKLGKSWSSQVDHYGRITIPAELRRKFGLAPGTRVSIRLKNGVILIRPLRRTKSALRTETPPAQKGS